MLSMRFELMISSAIIVFFDTLKWRNTCERGGLTTNPTELIALMYVNILRMVYIILLVSLAGTDITTKLG